MIGEMKFLYMHSDIGTAQVEFPKPFQPISFFSPSELQRPSAARFRYQQHSPPPLRRLRAVLILGV